MYLRIINSEDFLGFYKRDREKLILLPYFNNIYSNSIVNISGDEAIIIIISGDCICQVIQLITSDLLHINQVI